MKYLSFLFLLGFTLAGCAQQLTVKPVKVEPIHMTIDVNLHDDDDAPAKR
jgi:hypothetical protein